MNNVIYCSTGTMVGRANGWNYRLFTERGREIAADGFELMMVNAYYDEIGPLLSAIEKSGLFFGSIHAEKDIGIYLAGRQPGDTEQAMRLFRINCEVGRAIGAEKLVLHLWSGHVSDTRFCENLACLDRLYDIAREHSLRLLIENVPSVRSDAFSNLKRVADIRSDAGFVYDVRFGAFHSQNEEIIKSGWLESGRIEHLHISDYVGPAGDFSSLRPILHPGQGIIGLDRLLPRIFAVYDSTVTLESPDIHEEGFDADVINGDLEFIRKYSSSKA